MKNNLKVALICLFAFAVGMNINNSAISSPGNMKIAIVDINRLASNSSQIKNLNATRQRQLNELNTFVNNAKKEIAKEKDATKRRALETKYTNELNTKRNKINSDYTTKLKEIDRQITNVINSKAKAGKYDLVLKKDSVIYGGEDITTSVQQNVK